MRYALTSRWGAALAPALALAIVLAIALILAIPGMSADTAPKKDEPVEKVRTNRYPVPEDWKAPDQEKAIKRAQQEIPFVKDVKLEDKALRQQRLRALGIGIKDIPASYFWLDSPLVNTYEDKYKPVRFMHTKHAAALEGNCVLCHHYRPADVNMPETVACRACHQEAFNPEAPDRIGLKAAYHQQCMDCHKKMNQGPVSCTGCHAEKHVDHQKLVQLPPNPTPTQVTQECLRCHEDAGKDMLTSAHWLWRGPSPYTVGQEKQVMDGKATNTINNFCIAVPSNEPRCTSCHAGYGWKDNTFDFTDMSKMDCLICHDTTGSYKKAPPKAGMPAPEVDLTYVAQNVGSTSRNSCGECHFQGGGGDSVKHADMCSVLRYPKRNCDIHMGGYDFSCTECHKTNNHKISGRSSSVPVAEGARSCVDCHTNKPHYGENILDHHLNKHCDHLDCSTCHSPVYSKCKATKTWWDWSLAGDKERKPQKDKFGEPDYNWMKGEFCWKEAAKPEYAWYNGYVDRVRIGDVVDHTGAKVTQDMSQKDKMDGRYINLATPLGSMKDPESKISPFKIMRGIQPIDAKYDYLLVPHLFPSSKDDMTAYWKSTDWQAAFKAGMKAVNLEYSGEYDWVRTTMHWRIQHEVMPKESALSCVHCHESLKEDKTCDRCHQDNRDMDFKKMVKDGADFSFMKEQGRDVEHLIGTTDYIDFKALGYKGDPIIHGGRFKLLPLGQTAEKSKE